MSPNTGESSLVDGQTSQLENSTASVTDEQGEIWSSILKSVSSSKVVPTKNVLILGDKESGKSSLITNLKGKDDKLFEVPAPSGTHAKNASNDDDQSLREELQKNDLALSYTYMDIKDKDDEADDTIARLGLYQLAGSQPAYHSLLRFALNASTLPDSLVVIVLDWARPWTFISTLQRWVKVLEKCIEGIRSEGPIPGSKDGWTKGKVVVDEMKESLESFIQNYTEPDSSNKNPNVPVNDSDVALPLGPGTLTTNLGVPLIVVCTKADNTLNHKRDLDYKDQQFDYIQNSLRTICLKYGAALFYTSPQKSQTFENLRQYILHRLIGGKSSSSDSKYAFNVKAHVVECDAVMVPTGWDSWGKIKVLKEGFDCERVLQGWENDITESKPDGVSESGEVISAQKEYDEFVFHEDVDKPHSTQSEIVAEDEQVFFERHYETLQKAGDERVTSSPSVVGPISAATYAYTNIGGLDYDVEERMTKFRYNNKDTPKAASQPPPPSIVPPVNGASPASPANTAPPPSQNEVLHNFFQALLSKKASSNPQAGPPGQTSPDSSAPNLPPQSTKGSTTNGTTRKMVQEAVEKMRMPPSSQTASAVGK